MNATNRTRHGMTLIELLVAMSIIAILGALVATGIMSWMGTQARRNTEATIATVNKALQAHWDAVVNDAKKEAVPSAVLTLAGGAGKEELARVIWIKIRLMEAFPVNFDELKPSGDPAYPYKAGNFLGDNIPKERRRYLEGYIKTVNDNRTTGTPSDKTDSAACLLLALGVNRGASHNPDLFKAYTKDTNNDKIPELVDGWNEPLRFYRFPNQNNSLQSSRPPHLLAPKLDPADPKGRLLTLSGTGLTTYTTKVQEQIKDASNNAWYAVPVIISSGADLKLGLTGNNTGEGGAAPFQNMSETSSIDTADNISSFSLK